MKETMIVVLAAGIGCRYGGTKQLDSMTANGDTIIDFSLHDAINAGFSKVVFVVRNEILPEMREAFEKKLNGRIETHYVCQEIDAIPEKFLPTARSKPWGTAHALLTAKDFVCGNFCVINGDDFYGRSAFKKMFRRLQEADSEGSDFFMVGYLLKKTLSESGTVSRGQCFVNEKGFLTEIIERTKIERRGKKIICPAEDGVEIDLDENTIVSMNFWGFTDKVFPLLESSFDKFLESYGLEESSEYFIPAVVDDLIKADLAKVRVLTTTDQWMGVTYKADKLRVVEEIKALRNRGCYPSNLWK